MGGRAHRARGPGPRWRRAQAFGACTLLALSLLAPAPGVLAKPTGDASRKASATVKKPQVVRTRVRGNAAAAAAAPLGLQAAATSDPLMLAPSDEARSAADPITHFLTERGLLSEHGAAVANGWTSNASAWASDLVLGAMNFLGVPYRRGGESAEDGFDCSGFTRHVFERSVGLVLPRRSVEQARAPGWLDIDRDELKPGDLVFFNTLRSAFSHVGIYVGDGKFIHAPRTGATVRVEDMRGSYWTRRYDGARRAPRPVDVQAVLGSGGLDATPLSAATAVPSVTAGDSALAAAPATLY